MISFIDFIFPCLQKHKSLCDLLHNFDFGCCFEYANYMGGCEDKHCPAVAQVQIRNYGK